MLYNYFTGQLSYTSAVNKVVDVLISKVPGVSQAKLASSIGYKLKAIINATDGFSWTDLGDAIVDIGKFICDLTPAAQYGKVIAALWEVSSTL